MKNNIVVTSSQLRAKKPSKSVKNLQKLCRFRFVSCPENQTLDLEIKLVSALQEKMPVQLNQCFGVFARQALPKGFRMVYSGDRIKPTEAEFDQQDSRYLFQLSPAGGSAKSISFVDAGKRGDESRFVNHSLYFPNLFAELVGQGQSRQIHYVALREISPGEQLLLNYGSQYDFPDEPIILHPYASQAPISEEELRQASPENFARIWDGSVIYLSPLMKCILNQTAINIKEDKQAPFLCAAPVKECVVESRLAVAAMKIDFPFEGMEMSFRQSNPASVNESALSVESGHGFLKFEALQTGRTPLWYAVMMKHHDAISFLLKIQKQYACDLVHQILNNGNTVLMELMSFSLSSPDYFSCVKQLLEDLKERMLEADQTEMIRLSQAFFHQNKKDETLLHLLFSKDNQVPSEITQLVFSFYFLIYKKLKKAIDSDEVEMSVDPFDYLDEEGFCPLMRAIKRKCVNQLPLMINFIKEAEFSSYSMTSKEKASISSDEYRYIKNQIGKIVEGFLSYDLVCIFSFLSQTTIFSEANYREELIYLAIEKSLESYASSEADFFKTLLIRYCIQEGWLPDNALQQASVEVLEQLAHADYRFLNGLLFPPNSPFLAASNASVLVPRPLTPPYSPPLLVSDPPVVAPVPLAPSYFPHLPVRDPPVVAPVPLAPPPLLLELHVDERRSEKRRVHFFLEGEGKRAAPSCDNASRLKTSRDAVQAAVAQVSENARPKNKEWKSRMVFAGRVRTSFCMVARSSGEADSQPEPRQFRSNEVYGQPPGTWASEAGSSQHSAMRSPLPPLQPRGDGRASLLLEGNPVAYNFFLPIPSVPSGMLLPRPSADRFRQEEQRFTESFREATPQDADSTQKLKSELEKAGFTISASFGLI